MEQNYTLIPTNRFKKDLKKLSEEVREKAEETVDQLSKNPKHPGLRSKKNYQWTKHMGFATFECSINMSYRIIYSIENNRIILLHAVGNHQVVEKTR